MPIKTHVDRLNQAKGALTSALSDFKRFDRAQNGHRYSVQKIIEAIDQIVESRVQIALDSRQPLAFGKTNDQEGG